MQKFAGKFMLVLALVLMVSGCKPKVDGEKLVREAMLNSFDIKQQETNVSVEGDYQIDDKAKGEKLNGDFSVNLNGYFEETEDFRPVVDMKFLVDLTGMKTAKDSKESIGVMLDAEAKILSDYSFFFRVNKLSGETVKDLAQFLPTILGNWWTIALPEETLADLNPSLLASQTEQTRKIFENANLLKAVKVKGKEDLNGIATYRVTGLVDQEGVAKYFEEVAKLSETEIGAEDLAQMKELVKIVSKSTDFNLWITADDKPQIIQTKMKLALSLADFKELANTPEAAADTDVNGKINADLTIAIDKINVKRELTAPEGAKNLEEVLGGLLGGAMMNAPVPTQ